MKKLITILFMLLIFSNINAQIESDITFNYRNIKTDTIIKYPMASNFQWNLSLKWDTISTAPDSLYTEQSRLQDSINLYASDTLLYYNLAKTNCGDTLKYDSIADTLLTLKNVYLEIDTTLQALKDSASIALTTYLNLDTTYNASLDSIPIYTSIWQAENVIYKLEQDSALITDSITYTPLIDSMQAQILIYTALRDTAYLTDTATALLYQDTINTFLVLDTLYKDSLLYTFNLYQDSIDVNDTLIAYQTTYKQILKNLISANKVNILSTQKYITGITGQITKNLTIIQVYTNSIASNTLLRNNSDSLCTYYNSLFTVADTTVDYYLTLRGVVDANITLSDSLIGVSLQYTIYMSNDGVNWNLYSTEYDVTTTESTGNIMLEDTNFTGKWFGLRIRSTSVTRGYIRGHIITKKNTR
jgi:hypothetical protein